MKLKILKKFNILYPNNLFSIRDAEISTEQYIRKSIAIHLCIAILILIPFDIIFKKNIPIKSISIGVVSSKYIKVPKPNITQNRQMQKNITDEIGDIKELIEPLNMLSNKSDIKNKNKMNEKTILTDTKSKAFIKDDKLDIKDKNKSSDNVKQKQIISDIISDFESQKTNNKDNPNKNSISNTKVDEPSKVHNNTANENIITEDINSVNYSEEINDIDINKKKIYSQLHKCWVATTIKSNIETDIFVIVQIILNNDGQIIGYEFAEHDLKIGKQMSYEVAKNNAKIALENCKTIKGLNKEKYEEWKKIKVKFKYSDVEI